jgi:transcriptional regulator with XRE-family HTH domain
MSIKQIFSQTLSFLLNKNKISKQTLADSIGLSRPAVSQFANGANLPSIEKMIDIANYFNVSLDFLVGRSLLYQKPEADLPYVFKDNNNLVIGTIRYVFGITTEKYAYRKFLYMDETEGDLIENIIRSTSQLEFLSLAYLLNNKLQLNYDAINNNGIDLLIKFQGEYREIAIEYGCYSARVTPIHYEEYISYWLGLSTKDKINQLEKLCFQSL